ncbi:hypothetical protein HY837_01995 [archaeon]|nr:hypothetical protein [archaeon]
MKIKKFLIAYGNSTALVYDCPVKNRLKIIKKLLLKVEQVGFVSARNKFPQMQMMVENYVLTQLYHSLHH